MKRYPLIFRKENWPYFLIGLLILAFVALRLYEFESYNIQEVKEYSGIISKKESCFQCHVSKSGFSEYHNPELIGCVSCHLGNPESNEKEISHLGMVLIPGNLSDAEETCGSCHKSELDKVKHSLMTTNSGIVAVDKFVFGETMTPDQHHHITKIKQSAADKHLRDLCANCHLGNEKKEFGEINQLSRGGGCNACHLNYSDNAKMNLTKYLESDKKILPLEHPSTDIFIRDEHCFGCHSRSSRISTNYMGWQETLLDEQDIPDKENYKVFEDKRVYKFQQEDVHHAGGLLCIDCHSSHEVMGNGKRYLHQEDAVSLKCADCHYKEKPNTINYDSLDVESALVFMHRKYEHQDKRMLKVNEDGHPLVNTYVDENDMVILIGKKNGQLFEIKKQGSTCSRDSAHKNVSCASCHSNWAPRCIGCHNSFDKDEVGYDLLDKKAVKGQWIEYVSEFSAEQPALGIRIDGLKRTVEPAIPGMIMTIDHASYDNSDKENSFHRLYAPNSPHTVSKISRDCKSCHSNSNALGYGMGELIYDTSRGYGKWIFKPIYEKNTIDGLPEDAWIPFLEKQTSKIFSTRTNFRPFTLAEQKRMLLVGACLACHKEDSEIMNNSLTLGLDSLLLKISKDCIIPKK